MEIQRQKVNAEGIRFSIKKDGKEVARARLYLMNNDLHKEPFGFIEDVYVDEAYRGGVYFGRMMKTVIEEARQKGCYKLIDTSRFERKKVHDLYKKLGFREQGLEFRMDF
jgi:GNAT superfamily N-acetyltransferase